jgi:hypothetical protein
MNARYISLVQRERIGQAVRAIAAGAVLAIFTAWPSVIFTMVPPYTVATATLLLTRSWFPGEGFWIFATSLFPVGLTAPPASQLVFA